MEYGCEEITKSPDALKYRLGSQISGKNVAGIQFLPRKQCGYRRVSSAGTEGIGGPLCYGPRCSARSQRSDTWTVWFPSCHISNDYMTGAGKPPSFKRGMKAPVLSWGLGTGVLLPIDIRPI